MLKRLSVFLFILVLTSLTFAQISAQGAAETTATTLVALNMRDQPSQSGAILVKLPQNTTVVIAGRDTNETWLLVYTQDRQWRGWMAIQYLQINQTISIRDLPDLTGVDLSAPFNPDETAVPIIPPERNDYPPLWLDDATTQNARAIYARGQQLGNNPNSLIKIGESNTAGTVYMCTFNYGNFDLGPHQDLKPVVDRFNSTGSFCHYDYTARSGFATANLLDPQWAIEAECQTGETPLECGYRIYKPSYAIIYLGIADMGFYSEMQFYQNLTSLLTFLSDHGVVPILTTYPMADTFNDGKPQSFNAVIRDVAITQHVPLMDVRSVLHDYANHGTGPDGYHLSVRDPNFTSFAGDETTYGRTMRELMTLQMLQALSF